MYLKFLRNSSSVPPAPTCVTADFDAPDPSFLPYTMTIASRVTYHTPGGGTGLKFVYRDGDGSRRLRELVRRLVAS